MISLGDMRPAWRRPARAQQRRLPLWQKRLAEIIDLAKNLDDPIQHHRLRHSAMAAYLKKPFSHNPLIAQKLLIRVIVDGDVHRDEAAVSGSSVVPTRNLPKDALASTRLFSSACRSGPPDRCRRHPTQQG